MKFYDIDYKRFVRLMLPTMLRHDRLTAFLDAMVAPVITLYYQFRRFRQDAIYRLTITPQVCYLERLLNDRFDIDQRRIFITDGVFYDSLYLYTDGENNDLYAYNEAENKPVPLYTAGESGAESADFIVNIPASLNFDLNEFKALLNAYKLVSKTYSINK